MSEEAHAVMAVSDVVFREDLYPRLETSPTTVQKYAEDLDVLAEIKVNQRNELIDGWHTWTAHKKAGAKTIRCVVIETTSDAHLLELAIETNATHGLQLSQDDKQNMARRIYNGTPERERDEKKKHLAAILSVSERTIREWTGRIDKDSKEARNRRIFERWLANYTQEEIAEQEGLEQRQTSNVISEFSNFGNLAESAKSSANHNDGTDEKGEPKWKPPVYNVWKQQTKTAGSSHFGNSESRWVDNLLYLYTKPFDVVVDPFAGGGSTIDVCKKRLRRYFVSDRKPIVEREKDIRKHDLTEGLPPVHNWKDVKLVYLDPPYWWQAKGQYSDDPSDLANMTLDEFNKSLSGIIKAFSKKLTDAFIALIIQPTQWNAPERQFTDHVGDMLRLVALPVDMRFSVPYESQQGNAQMVQWAQQNKRCLVLTREIVVWKVA